MTAVGIDIGGTFTDLVVLRDDGSVRLVKSATTQGRLLDGVLDAASEAAEREGESLDTLLAGVQRIAHGTTAATNAYIERRGAEVAVLTTRGFEDTLTMQRMMGMTAGLSTSELTDYSKRSVPEPLAARSQVYGIRERVDCNGTVIGPLVEEDVRAAARAIAQSGITAVAVCYLWSFKNSSHEKRTREILEEALPGGYFSISHELVPRLGEYERTATAVANAYLGPLIRDYTDALAEKFSASRLFLLDSAGGVMTPDEAGRKPVRLLLSGPSGGVTAAGFLGAERGDRNIITFDMGGTSTDVALIVDGAAVKRKEAAIGKYHFLLSMVDVRAIGAGGGSIARVEDGGYLRVGPQSAGADPGPACYGRGGEYPTVTDADVVLGIIDPARFLGGRLQLDVALARSAIEAHVARPLNVSVEEAAAGIKRIVDTRMADLLRTVTIEQGHDPSEFVLYAFGGAGATHAPSFALEVVDKVVVPASQAVFCAFGAVASDVALSTELAVPMRVARNASDTAAYETQLSQVFTELERQADTALAEQGVEREHRDLQRIVEMRFTRQLKTLPIAFSGEVTDLLRDFLIAYAKRYGEESVPEAAGFEFVTLVVEATGKLSRPELARFGLEGADAAHALRGSRKAFDAGRQQFVDTPVYTGEDLRAGNELRGPGIVEYEGSTVVLLSGQSGRVDELLSIEIRSAT